MSVRVVILEDDPLVCELIREILSEEGFTDLYSASNGVDGLELIRRTCPKLLITDIVMPEKDGVSVIRELKDEFPDLKIIAISGGGFNSPRYYLKIAKQVGCDRIIQKPVSEEELLQAVNKLLS